MNAIVATWRIDHEPRALHDGFNPVESSLVPPHLHAHAGKWARGGWAASDDDERRVKEETQATLRCFPFDQVSFVSSKIAMSKKYSTPEYQFKIKNMIHPSHEAST